MRIPTDISIAAYIKQLMREDKLPKFYLTDDWKELRQEVLDDHHNECHRCAEHGNYTTAVCVHHVNEVRNRPDLALSKYYIDTEGQKQKNLIPLCNECHNIVHDKLGNWQKKDKFTNTELW